MGNAFKYSQLSPSNDMKIDVTFDTAVFSLDAVKTACYKFLDRFTPEIELCDAKIVCHLDFADKSSDAVVSASVDNLKKEVLDQDFVSNLKLRQSQFGT